MESPKSKIIDYKDIKIRVTRNDNLFVLEPILNQDSKTKPFKLYCDSDEERFLKKVYMMIKNPGLFVG